MNTNPKAKRILIYGDSIPWGIIAGTKPFKRYPSDVRWPGRLQIILGKDYEVLEENLVGRTLSTDDQRPGFEGRNGLGALATIIDSQDPLDFIVISLGLNEAKKMFDQSVNQISKAMKALLLSVQDRKPNFNEVNPKIIIILPPVTDEEKAKKYWGEIWDDSSVKAGELGTSFKTVALDLGIEVFEVNDIVLSSYDGVHLNEVGHDRMASEFSKRIKSYE